MINKILIFVPSFIMGIYLFNKIDNIFYSGIIIIGLVIVLFSLTIIVGNNDQ